MRNFLEVCFKNYIYNKIANISLTQIQNKRKYCLKQMMLLHLIEAKG